MFARKCVFVRMIERMIVKRERLCYSDSLSLRFCRCVESVRARPFVRLYVHACVLNRSVPGPAAGPVQFTGPVLPSVRLSVCLFAGRSFAARLFLQEVAAAAVLYWSRMFPQGQ